MEKQFPCRKLADKLGCNYAYSTLIIMLKTV